MLQWHAYDDSKILSCKWKKIKKCSRRRYTAANIKTRAILYIHKVNFCNEQNNFMEIKVSKRNTMLMTTKSYTILKAKYQTFATNKTNGRRDKKTFCRNDFIIHFISFAIIIFYCSRVSSKESEYFTIF